MEMLMPGVYHPPGKRKPSLRYRIRRRARELGMLAEQSYQETIIRELHAGKLADENIENWEPPNFEQGMLRHHLLRARDALQAAIATSAILFP